MKRRQIFISGPSGSGKTTLASYISRNYRIPFVSGSSKEIWKEFGIGSHREIIEMTTHSPTMGLEFQQRLLRYREEKLRGLGEFITDRGPLDNLVYFMLQNSPYLTHKQTNLYIEMCNRQFHLYDSTQIYLEPHADKLVDDGKRINNAYYQEMTHALYQHFIKYNWVVPERRVHVIKEWNWVDRTQRVKEILNPQSQSIWQGLKEKLGL